MATSLTPNVLWAQRKDRVLLTIDVPDILPAPKIDLTAAYLSFAGDGPGGKHYEFKLDFFKEVNVEQSRWGVLPRHIQLNIVKQESGPYWDRLTQDSGKKWFLKTDWGKWVEEDESEGKHAQERDFNFDDLDMGGGGGDDFNPEEEEDEDDDEDEMPALEEDDKPTTEVKSSEHQLATETGSAEASQSTQTHSEEKKE